MPNDAPPSIPPQERDIARDLKRLGDLEPNRWPEQRTSKHSGEASGD